MHGHHANALELRILMAIASKLAGRDLEQRLQAQGLPISSMQHGMLRMLSQQPYTISELSRKMKAAPATMVPSVDGLERHGLLVRGHDPHDRRRTPLSLTDQGKDILARVPVVDDQDLLVQSLDTLGSAQAEQLLLLLRQLLGIMMDDPGHVRELAAQIHQMG